MQSEIDLAEVRYKYVRFLGRIARRGRAADGKVFDLAEEGPPSTEKVDHASGWARTQARAQKRHSPDRG